MGNRGGRAEQRLRAHMLPKHRAANAPCWLCGQPISYSIPAGQPDAWSPDHFHPVATHPELRFDPANIRASHLRCNQNRGAGAPTDIGQRSRQW